MITLHHCPLLIRDSPDLAPPPRATSMPTGLPAALLREKPFAIRDSQSTRRLCLAATTHARAAPARSSSTAMGRPKRCTELLHRGSLDNCHLCGRFNFFDHTGIADIERTYCTAWFMNARPSLCVPKTSSGGVFGAGESRIPLGLPGLSSAAAECYRLRRCRIKSMRFN
jgi:hypothetical protein